MLNTINFLQRNTRMRFFLMLGIMLLSVTSVFAQVPAKSPQQVPGIKIVSDSVLKNGNKISGGWYEYASDGSWRRVAFTIDAQVGTIVFGDGKPGTRMPSVTRYAWVGPGRKDASTEFDETRRFTDVTSGQIDKSNLSSQIPEGVATRVRELGGDIRLLRRLANITQRMKDVGSAFDAARQGASAGGLTSGFPGTATPGRKGNWSDPRGGIGRDGRASEMEVISNEYRTGTDGSSESHIVMSDGSITYTFETHSNAAGETSSSVTMKDSQGNIIGGYNTGSSKADGTTFATSFTRDSRSGQINFTTITTGPEGKRTVTGRRGTPPESGTRRGYEEEVAKHIPWLADANYAQWKRESDLVKSGGRISQPGRGEPSTMIVNESPDIGASAVVNCGDSNTTPCNRAGRIMVNPRGAFDKISQPGRGVPTGPIDGKEQPKPIPVPEPKP